MDFESAVKYLESFVSYEDREIVDYDKIFELKRIRDFLDQYGVDYRSLKCLHVAGSKGKGSVSRMMADYLVAAGNRVGLFSSPHFIDVREDFWLNGGLVSEAEFVKMVEDLRDFIETAGGCKLTCFELRFVLVMKYFVEQKVDFAVLEVGLGGRLDPTNVVVKPLVSVINRIEMEHVGVLGDTLSEIIDQKLGIVKDGVPVVVGFQSEEARGLIEEKLAGRGGVTFVEDLNVEVPEVAGSLIQTKNAKVAKMALEKALGGIDAGVFAEVMRRFRLPGRFDVRVINAKTVVFDMAHTESSIWDLVESLKVRFPEKEFVFLVAMVKGKNTEAILSKIEKVAEKIVFTNCHNLRGVPAEELTKFVDNAEVEQDYKKAFEDSLEGLEQNQILVVTGSHFLIGKLFGALHVEL